MREIKFRGMAHDDWYYGDLIIANDTKKSKHYYIITEDYEGDCIELGTCASPEVEQGTVGQYAGLEDKNGKEIYEGDILKYTYNKEESIDFIEYDGNMFTYHNAVRWNLQDDEVIGNIYENKELLEG